MAKALQEDFPEVINTVRIDKNDAIIVRYEGKQYYEDKILLTDPSFFDVFSYKLSEGDEKTALNEPYNIILTQSMAKKYFGKESPLGKSLMILLYDSTRHGALYKITGVIPDPTKNAHFTFNFLASFKTLEHAEPESRTVEGWGNNGYYTYILLKDKNDIHKLESKLPAFTERHMGTKMKEWKMRYDFTLQPLTSIHLHSNCRKDRIGFTIPGRSNHCFTRISFCFFRVLSTAATGNGTIDRKESFHLRRNRFTAFSYRHSNFPGIRFGFVPGFFSHSL